MESVTLSDLESFLEPDMDSPAESEFDPREGFIFAPTDEESIRILEHKASYPDFYYPAIYKENIYGFEPYELHGLPAIQSDGNFYFFCVLTLDASGKRYRRHTRNGYWKITCKPVKIKDKRTHEEIGERRTLGFYSRFPGCSKGVRTNWMMHEYSAYANNNNPLSKNLVVCRIKEDREKEKVKKEDKKRRITGNENGLARKRLISTNDVEPQLPPGCYLISSPRSDAVENTNLEWHCYSVSNVNNHAVEDPWLVDPLPFENLNVLYGSTRLNQNSFSTQSIILPEQGNSSSSVSINENQMLNSSCGSESQGEDYLQEWLSVALDEVLNEETRHTRGFCGGDSSDVGTEIFNTCADEAFWNNTLGSCVDHI